jgi:hypothetical protein
VGSEHVNRKADFAARNAEILNQRASRDPPSFDQLRTGTLRAQPDCPALHLA